MEKGISYLNRTYADYRRALVEYSKKYFPEFNVTYDDASVAAWLIGINAAVADDLSYHIDRVYQETNIDSANERASLYNIARNNGVKIPGPKGSMAEVRFSCQLPANGQDPNWEEAPIVKRGTKVGSASQQFELLYDVDFKSQFNDDGVSDRTIVPNVNTNGVITGYTVSKLAVVVAGDTRIYRQSLSPEDIKPFMEIILPAENVMNVESVLIAEGKSIDNVPSYGQFYDNREIVCEGLITRFFEVDNLAQPDRWADDIDEEKNIAKRYYYSSSGKPIYCVTKGKWEPVSHKFITEYTDNGYLKIIFGSGVGNVNIGDGMSDFSKWQITRILNNNALGVLPNANSTVYVLYRVGGGASSNVAAGAISRISQLNVEYRGERHAISVINTTPSVSGKDMPSNAELRYLIKYHNAAQERCVTVKDYVDRILNMPPRYGTPFRVGVAEENNKIAVYLLGLDNEGKLSDLLPITLIKNIERYLERYRMINDFVEIKAGRIINVGVKVDAIIDKNYNKSDVVKNIIKTVRTYFDINDHMMGEEIYVGDLEKEVSKVDGVINLIGIEISPKNGAGDGYSQTSPSQPIAINDEGEEILDLEVTDGVIYNDGDTMVEIKNPGTDIIVRIKER